MCNWLIFSYFRPADRRPSKVISKAFSAPCPRLDQRWRAAPYTSAMCAEVSPVVNPLADSEITSSTPVSRRCRLATIFGSKEDSR